MLLFYVLKSKIVPQPLSNILIRLQNKYNVQFNYAEDIIAGILINPPSKNFSLEETFELS